MYSVVYKPVLGKEMLLLQSVSYYKLMYATASYWIPL